MSIILFFTLVLSACGPANMPTVSQSVTPTPAESPEDTQLEYTSQDFGFSLHYPKGYEMQRTFAHKFSFVASQGAPEERGYVDLEVERILDQDARWFADQLKQENANVVGLNISSSMRVIDGQQAYILEPIPGQNLSRQVFIVNKGFLYHLTFLPDDPQIGAAYQQMETLYAAVMDSLRFLPEREVVPPVLSVNNMVYQLERALEARSGDDILRLLGDELTIISWDPKTPERYTPMRYGRNEAARLIMDQYLSQAPDLVPQYQTDPTIQLGDSSLFANHFSDENVTPVLVKGWGPQGTGEAVMIIARRMDGSLFWRGMYIGQETIAP